MQTLTQSYRTSRVGRLGHLYTVLFLLYIRGLKLLLVFYFRVEEKFAGGKFREIPFAVDIIFAGGTFRAKSKIANIYSTRKMCVIQYSIFNFYTCLDVIFPHHYTCSSNLYISDNEERNTSC